MPTWRYSAFDLEAADRRELLEKLHGLFNDLLLQTGGDVDEALRYLEQIGRRYGVFDERLTMEEFEASLERKGIVAHEPGGGVRLTAKGERTIRAESLDGIFGSLRKDAQGDHRVPHAGSGTERLPETRAWRFGDPLDLIDAGGTIQAAVRRGGIEGLTITEEDLQVHETEHASACATVLMVDVSHSMVLYGEDRITPAKRVALALAELITTRYPKDSLQVLLFGDDAWEVPLDELVRIQVGPYHTNTRAGLRLAQDMLRKRKQANRQIFMVTDGKPSALTERDGTIYRNPFGLDERIVNKTIDEAASCRRHGIPITTFMLTDEPVLVDFVERFTETNRGRAYYSRPDALGSFVFVDYIRNRRRRSA